MHVTRQAQVGWLLSVKQHVTEINRYCIVLPPEGMAESRVKVNVVSHITTRWHAFTDSMNE